MPMHLTETSDMAKRNIFAYSSIKLRVSQLQVRKTAIVQYHVRDGAVQRNVHCEA